MPSAQDGTHLGTDAQAQYFEMTSPGLTGLACGRSRLCAESATTQV